LNPTPLILAQSNFRWSALTPCGLFSASSFLQISDYPRETRRKDLMIQLPLFPPAAAPDKPLPDAVRRQAGELVSALLMAVISASEKQGPRDGDSDE